MKNKEGALDIVGFLENLRNLGILVKVDQGKLRVKAPKEAMTPEIQRQIAEHKEAILSFHSSARQGGDSLIEVRERVPPFPITFPQRRLWFINQLEGASSAYNIAAALLLEGPLNHSAFGRSVTRFLARHEGLRVNFSEEDGRPLVILHQDCPDVVRVLEAEDDNQARALAHEAVNHVFDLAGEILIQVRLIRVAAERHYLVILMHHIISDGWSMGILVRELIHLYQAESHGHPSNLPSLPIQYLDFAWWQNQWLESQQRQQQTQWWLNYLEDSPPLLPLPTDKPRSATGGLAGATLDFRLDRETSQKLSRLALDSGSTLFMVLETAFAVLLSRYSGQNDILIGTPVANRNHPGTEGLVGYFVNTLVLRTRLEGSFPFLQLLDRVRPEILNAFSNQDLPFDLLVELLQPDRNAGHSPIFQVMFVLQNTPSQNPEVAGVRFSPLEFPRETALFDLTLAMTETGDGLMGNMEYSTSLFEVATIRSLIQHFTLFLQQILANPGQSIFEISLMDEVQKGELLLKFSQSPEPAPLPCLLLDLMRESAQKEPDRELLILVDPARPGFREVFTRHFVWERAERVAAFLQSRGVGHECVVGICMGRCAEFFIAQLAIGLAGGVYLPIMPDLPIERKRYMLHQAGAALVLTRRADLDSAAEADLELVVFEDAAERYQFLPPVIHLENLVYIIFTSGSTGRPKGVALSHRALANTILSGIRRHAHPGPLRMFCALALSFDAGNYPFFHCFVGGGLLISPVGENPMIHPRLLDIINRQQVSILELPGSLLASNQPGEMPTLLRIVTGGEACPPEAVAAWAVGRTFYNEYGPTETAITATSAVCEPGRPITIGRANGGTTAYILDAYGQLQLVKTPGELFLGGAGLARGYQGQPGQTAEKFIPDAFGGLPGQRLYRTGDLARFLADGQIDFMGRVDFQLKIRGFRIEPGEIEAALEQHPQVERALVLAVATAGSNQLVAWLARGEQAIPEQELQRLAADRLPEYMVPQVIVQLERFPLTSHGKVDRKKLPQPEFQGASSNYVAPRSEIEKKLVLLWQELLQREPIGIHDNFFKLGGHSLLATRVIAAIETGFGVDVPLKAIFSSPTIAQLAVVIGESGSSGAGLPPIKPIEEMEHFPLSFAQERIWFLYRLGGPSFTYNMPTSLRLNGSLDVRALAASFRQVLERHRILRTTYHDLEGVPYQKIGPVPVSCLARINLSGLPNEIQQEEVLRLVCAHERIPFLLESGPLFRASLLELGAKKHVLLVNMHHIISDGWSISLFIREVTQVYAWLTGVPGASGPVALPFQYTDYAWWQRTHLEQELEDQLVWWQGELAGVSGFLDLPLDRPRPAVMTYNGSQVKMHFDLAQTQKLEQLARDHDASLFMVLLTVFHSLLYRITGQNDILVGSPIGGRRAPGSEQLIGMFLNNLVLRARMGTQEGEPLSFRQLLIQVRNSCLNAYEHQDLPFERLLDGLKIQRSQSHNPLFQVYLNMLQVPAGEDSLGDLSISGFEEEDYDAKFDQTLYVARVADGLSLRLSYNRDLFSSTRMRHFMDQFQRLAFSFAADPDQRLRTPSLVTPTMEPLLPDPSQALDFPWPGDVFCLFKRQATAQAEAVAICSSHVTWSYAQVLEKSERVAARLSGAGLQQGEVVAIYAARVPALVPAMLGILQAGGVFACLDPAYPVGRLMTLLDLSQARFLIQLEQAGEPDSLFSQRISSKGLVRFLMDAAGSMPGSQADGNCCFPQISASDAACLTFTSGSTGMPKAVLGGHGSLTFFLPWLAEKFQMGRNDRQSMLSGLAHDPLQRDIFYPLCLGASLYIPENQIIRDLSLAHWMAENQISITNLTPAMGQILVEAGNLKLPHLKTVFFVGDRLLPQMVHGLYRIAPQVRVVNLYGCTESQRALGYFVVPRELEGFAGALPLGSGCKGSQLLVLGSDNRLCGIGEVGEIHIRSHHLAKAYLADPDLTAEKFITNPFSGNPLDRLYRTGDLGRYRPDGQVDFAGRADFQIEIRGYRVEPGEIEFHLQNHPLVSSAVVLALPDTAGEDMLVCWLQTAAEHGDFPSLIGQCQQLLKQNLPSYMMPRHFLPLSRLPLLPGGKIDRAALPRPQSDTLVDHEGDLPLGKDEIAVAAIWQEVLGLSQTPRRQSNFFALGGHSLMLVRVLSRIRSELFVDMPLQTMFSHPELQAFCSCLDQQRMNAIPKAKILAVPRTSELPLSFTQRRLWFLDLLGSGDAAYNMAFAFRLKGPLEVRYLDQSIGALVRRHEVLRAAFRQREGLPFAILRQPEEIQLQMLTPMEGPELESRIRQEAGYCFDLASEPLIRFQLAHIGPEQHVLLIVMHHIISDGWSMGILARELYQGYRARLLGETPQLPELKVQYFDFAHWQQQWLTGDSRAVHAQWWLNYLDGAPPLLELPLDRPRPTRKTSSGASAIFQLPAALTTAANALARENNATLFMVLQSLFSLLLARYSNQTDVVVGTAIANRNHAEVEPLIGFFANTLALRTDLSGNPGFRSLLARNRPGILGAFQHQDMPFDLLVDLLEPERSLSFSPVFQVIFVLQNAPFEPLEVQDLVFEPIPLARSTARFDLSLAATELGDEIELVVEFNNDLFEPQTISRMMTHYQRLLEAVSLGPDVPILSIPLVSDQEKAQILRELCSEPGSIANTSVYDLARRHGDLRPQAEALVVLEPEVDQKRQCYSFEQLYQRVDELAACLVARGVGPEVPVGVCMERSAELIISLLAVLRAGGILVPILNSFPEARKSFMVEDLGLDLVLIRSQDSYPRWGRDLSWLMVDEVRVAENPVSFPQVHGLNSAYVIYTSGSTGNPKGVVIAHGAICQVLPAVMQLYQLEPGARQLHTMAMGFDAALYTVLLSLCFGGTLCLVAGENPMMRPDLASLIEEEKADLIAMPPSVLKALTPAGPLPAVVLVGGDNCPPEVVENWAPGRRFYNEYGPTEVANTATVGQCFAGSAVTIGRPVSVAATYILDRFLNLQPAGIAGELVIAGRGLARGYQKLPGRTAAAFVPNPFATSPGSRCYRTGDLARFLPCGNIEFLGRIDHQIKLRGFRIELDEIQTACKAFIGSGQVQILLRKDLPGGACLVAYLATENSRSFDVGGLKTFLRDRLPEYMVPSRYLVLEKFPLTLNGKIDIRALHRLPLEDQLETEYQPPNTPLEQKLTAIWEDLLQVQPLGIKDNFFQRGGHSLLVIHLIDRIRTGLARNLPAVAIFEAPTIQELAAYLESASETKTYKPLVELQREGRKTPLFLVHQVDGNAHCYADLARCLEPDQPVYGLQSRVVFDLSPQETVEAIAAEYLVAIKEIQVTGPYQLAGWSAGGLIAFEIAQQIKAQGDEVRLLALLDSMPPGDAQAGKPGNSQAPLRRLLSGFEAEHQLNLKLSIDELMALVNDEHRLEAIHSAITSAREPAPPMPLSQLRSLLAHVLSSSRYVPKPWSGDLLLIQTEGASRSAQLLFWQSLSRGRFECRTMTAPHEKMVFPPHSQILAELLEEFLR